MSKATKLRAIANQLEEVEVELLHYVAEDMWGEVIERMPAK